MVTPKLPFPGRNFPKTEVIWYSNVIFGSLNALYWKKVSFVGDVRDKTKIIIHTFSHIGVCTLKGANYPVLYLDPITIPFRKGTKPH